MLGVGQQQLLELLGMLWGTMCRVAPQSGLKGDGGLGRGVGWGCAPLLGL